MQLQAVTTLNKQNQRSDRTSSERTTLVWISCHPVGPKVEDTFHVPTTPAKELNSIETGPEMGPGSVSELDAHCPAHSWVHQGSCRQGTCQGHVSAPRWELLQGVLGMLSTFFRTDKFYGKNLLPPPLFLRWEDVLSDTSMGPLSAEISGHQRALMLIAICNLSGRRASWVWKQWCPFA